MNILVMIATAMLAYAWDAGSTAWAHPWPQSAVSNYLSSCVTIHKERWSDVPEAVVTRLCTCKVSKLQSLPWDQFAKTNKEVNSYYLEQFVALPEDDELSVLEDVDGSVKLVMLRVIRAEEECAVEQR
jgi:hypothetical protein